jgi:hypothetical protein
MSINYVLNVAFKVTIKNMATVRIFDVTLDEFNIVPKKKTKDT